MIHPKGMPTFKKNNDSYFSKVFKLCIFKEKRNKLSKSNNIFFFPMKITLKLDHASFFVDNLRKYFVCQIKKTPRWRVTFCPGNLNKKGWPQPLVDDKNIGIWSILFTGRSLQVCV